MQHFNEIIEKLKDILSKEIEGKKIHDYNISEALGIPNTAFRKKKQNGSIPYYEIMQFLAKRKISINWFFFGQLPESIVDTTSQYVILKYNRSTFKAGSHEAQEDINDHDYIILDNMFVQYLNIDHTNTELIVVTGDSMEPTIKNGSLVFIDRSKIDDTLNGIYAFSHSTGLYIKRIKEIDGLYHVISDNAEYETQITSKEDIQIIGKVSGQLAIV